MGLEKYKKIRNFKETPEPAGAQKKSDEKLIFVIQRHKASRLHYDLRLEMDGVLKSWAVPKGPSLNPEDKRLAMMVEDHPFDYKDFAGVIPEGNYGAGIVEIWDSGTLSDIEENDKKTSEKNLKAGLASGSLKFTLKGKKLKGEFALVKIKGKEENAWLLIKHRDKYAVETEYNSEDHTPKNSPINKWLANKNKTGKKTAGNKLIEKVSKTKKAKVESNPEKPVVSGPFLKTKKLAKVSGFIPAMLAKEVKKAFSDEEWIYEIKWDGYRAIAELNKADVKLYSRNGNSFNEAYPVVVSELKKLKLNAVLDGELVIINKDGNPDFQKLQHYAENTHLPLVYYVFDLLELKGKALYDLPLIERKAMLKEVLKKNPIIQLSDHVAGNGEAFFEVASKKGLEGIMAKKADSHYLPGKRSSEWLKIKNNQTADAIICGFTEPRNNRNYFGALVLGIYKENKLTYIGHTGSGFDQKLLKEIWDLLQATVQEQSPFNAPVKTNMPVTWVKPKYVCEVKFTERTRDGKLRHPIFLKLVDEKSVKEVKLEEPAVSEIKPNKLKAAALREAENDVKLSDKKKPRAAKKPATLATKDSEDIKEKTYRFGRHSVKTTNRNKVFFPGEGITKGDVIDYYHRIAPHILPYLKNRPESLFRTPNGIEKGGFFHKDAATDAPDFVDSMKVSSGSAKKEIDYIVCNNTATLLYMANLGCIELNPWHSTVKTPDKPDYLIIDIDPSEKNTFDDVVEAAQAVKEVLDKAGATGFCKTSGATGLHIYIPTGRKYTYDQVKDFAHLVCMLVNAKLPQITTLERSLKNRKKNQIYMDYLQNRKGQTIASVYSLRPKAGATVSTPLKWSEIKPGLNPKNFNIFTIEKRLKKTGDLFAGVLKKPVDLLKCIQNLEGEF